jgi:predicted permease
MSSHPLPRIVVTLVEWLVPDPVARGGLVGDLAERYASHAGRGAIGRALWLTGEIVAIAAVYGGRRELPFLDTLRQDVAFAVRSMLHRPGFTLLVVSTLALGIGANTAIFSVVDGLLLEPLPFDDADRLVLVDELEESGFTASVSFPNYRDWKERAVSFDRFSIILPASRRFVSGTGPTIVEVGWVGGGFFETLGTEPALGRYFSEAESEPGADRIAVLTHAFWTRAFGADPGVIGRTVELGDETYTVVGIAPPDFVLYEETSVFLPLGLLRASLPWDDRATSVGAEVVARVAPERRLEDARDELVAIGRALEEETGQVTGVGRATPLRERLVGAAGRQSLLLMAAVGLVLLIACANVANLLFVASERRGGEIAVRSALGASASRLHRQLLTETLLLGLLGGALGLGMAWLGVDALLRMVGDVLPAGFAGRVDVDRRTVLFTGAVALSVSIVAGLLPALRVAGAAIGERLRGSSSGAGGAGRARGVLVATEVAFSMVLLVGAGLLIATLGRLQHVDKGFDGQGILTLRLQTPDDVEKTRDVWADFHRGVRDEVGALPGVLAVSTSNHFPLSGNSWEQLYRDEQTPPDDRGESVLLTMVSPSFFDTWDVALLEGRGFTEADRWGDEPVAIVDETLAAARWPGESALGKRIAFEKVPGPDGEEVDLWRTVVGVSAHVRHYELSSPSRIEVYTPLAQSRAWGFTTYLSVRADSDPAALAAPVRSLLRDLEPDATLYRIRTADSVIDRELGLQRAMLEILSVMAALALLLGCVGIYSVVSHATALRLRELSLRIALGSAPGGVTRLVLRDSLGPIAAGIGAGALGAVLLGRLLRSVLYEVGPADPTVLATSGAILLLVATLSAWLPARRAGSVPPQEILRGE